MCTTCGCTQPSDAVRFTKVEANGHRHAHTHAHDHSHDHHHHHDHDHDHGHHHHHDHGHHHHHSHSQVDQTLIELEQDILQKNNLLAERNRGYFEAKNILALNLVSSPGSGKTSLLERTLSELKGEIPFAVIEGDQQTTNDADRIAATGAPVVQVNTGKGCHLDSEMVNQALKQLRPAEDSVLMIENVGNLVCPAMFDLGERARVVIFSVTEGDDKPLKYPDMFLSAQICLINKVDLLPYVPFDLDRAKEAALRVNHHLEFIEVSATNGQGLDQWYRWLKQQVGVERAVSV